MAEIAPGWQLASGYPRPNVEPKGEWQGEKGVVLILSKPEIPAVVVTEAELNKTKKPKLKIKIGHEANEAGEFRVRVDGDIIFRQQWSGSDANRWNAFSFDLAKYRGKRVVISLAYHSKTGNDHALWLGDTGVVYE